MGRSDCSASSTTCTAVRYLHPGSEASALEEALGVAVLRHTEKKPAGGVAEVEAHFGCPAHELVFVGDRWVGRATTRWWSS